MDPILAVALVLVLLLLAAAAVGALAVLAARRPASVVLEPAPHAHHFTAHTYQLGGRTFSVLTCDGCGERRIG